MGISENKSDLKQLGGSSWRINSLKAGFHWRRSRDWSRNIIRSAARYDQVKIKPTESDQTAECPFRLRLDVISFPGSSFPLTSVRKTRDSESNHFEITKGITEFYQSGLTALSAFLANARNGCSKGWSRGTKTLGTRLPMTPSLTI